MLACWVWAEFCFSAYGLAIQAEPAPAARAGELVQFDIAPQPMHDALLLFMEQSGANIVFTVEEVAGLGTRGVRGAMPVREALGKLIAGTPLYVKDLPDSFSLGNRAMEAREAKQNAAATHGSSATLRRKAQGPPSVDWLDGSADGRERGMTVTGSHIRKRAPISPRPLTIPAEDIERMGWSTVAELIETVPQSFGGGPTEDTSRGLEAETNSARGFAINLRGLGAGGTLPLLNGRRFAAGGSEGSFVDLSAIPLSAIGRVEILAAAASPQYGSDAVGGVVNFVTRSDATAETLVRGGMATAGGLGEYLFAQNMGMRWDDGGVLFAVEVSARDALRAEDRDLARSDLRRFGGDDFDTSRGNPGTLIDGGVTYAIPPGQDGRSLEAADLVAGSSNRYDLRRGSDLLPEQRRVSAVVSLQHDLAEGTSIYSDVLYTRRLLDAVAPGVRAPLVVPSTNPFFVSPGGNPAFVVVDYSFEQDLGQALQDSTVDTANVALGSKVELGGGWLLDAYLGYALEQQDQVLHGFVDFDALAAALADPDPTRAFNPFGDGSHTSRSIIDTIRASQRLRTDSELRSVNATADGPVLFLPGGEAMLALGAEYREQSFASSNVASSPRGVSALRNDFGRSVTSVFSELRIPLYGKENARAGLRSLEISLAGRHERYSDFGDKTVPGAGLAWSPLAGVTLRGSWSQSFKAPNLADLDESGNGSQIFALVDPADPGGGPVPMLLWFGKNADLREETATNWTAGLDLAPASVPGLSVSFTWFDVLFKERVQEIASAFPNLADPRIAPFVNRAPTAAEREAVCSRSAFLGALADCLAAPIRGIADLRVQNIAQNSTRGVDLHLQYAADTRAGELELDVLATRLFDFAQSFSRTGQQVDLLDTQTNPLDFRLRSTLSWQRRGLGATLAVNYADDYRDVSSEPARRVDDWTTFDLQLRYEWPDDGGWLGGTRASLSVRNLFDDDPPFFNNQLGIGYDQENADLNGRTFRLTLTKSW